VCVRVYPSFWAACIIRSARSIGNLPAAFGGTRDPFEAALEAALGIGRP
jgi:hypothetical protein